MCKTGLCSDSCERRMRIIEGKKTAMKANAMEHIAYTVSKTFFVLLGFRGIADWSEEQV